jgi:cysteine desulfurase
MMGTMAVRAYLDHNASSPLRPAAAEAMARALQLAGNPSSVHAEGRAARAAVDRARHQVAAAVGGEARNVIFTSGATEALNMALRPSPALTFRSGAKRTERLLILATEHSAALAGGGFAADAIECIPVGTDGRADLGWLQRRLGELATIDGKFAPVTVAMQLANSETGVIHPIREASRIADNYGALFICDSVPSLGRISVSLPELNVDAVVLSAHKFGGPKGVGALVLNGDHAFIEEPLLKGGGQEMRRRSGTENLAGIVGMGIAAEEAVAALPAEASRLAALRNDMLARFRAIRPDLVVFGEAAARLPNTAAIALPGLKAETAVIAFDLANVAVSSGAACASGKVKRSHVLDAMGVAPELADGLLRFSLGWTTTSAEIDIAAAAFAKIAGAAAARAA